MAKFEITLTRTTIETKTVEIEVEDGAARQIADANTSSATMWAIQQGLAAPGGWTKRPALGGLPTDITATWRQLP